MSSQNAHALSSPFPLFEGRHLLFSRTLIMGILNVTENSFYKGSRLRADHVLERAQQMVSEGVDILDIGAESTRPNAQTVSVTQEIDQLIPAVEMLRKNFPEMPISADTRKSSVAKEAIQAGADIINDVSGFCFDAEMATVIAENKAAAILMHSQGTPDNMQNNPHYENIRQEIYDFFLEKLNFASSCGLSKERIILDPGIGFGKNLSHNLSILRDLTFYRSLGRPLLIGASRKSMIGDILQLPDPQDRLEGTLAITSVCSWQGVEIVRVHDVAANAHVAKVCDAIKWSK